MNEPATLGELIHEARERKGLSVRQLANLSGGIHASAITRIEKDLRDPTIASLTAIARGLDLTFTITGDGLTVKQNRSRRNG